MAISRRNHDAGYIHAAGRASHDDRLAGVAVDHGRNGTRLGNACKLDLECAPATLQQRDAPIELGRIDERLAGIAYRSAQPVGERVLAIFDETQLAFERLPVPKLRREVGFLHFYAFGQALGLDDRDGLIEAVAGLR